MKPSASNVAESLGLHCRAEESNLCSFVEPFVRLQGRRVVIKSQGEMNSDCFRRLEISNPRYFYAATREILNYRVNMLYLINNVFLAFYRDFVFIFIGG